MKSKQLFRELFIIPVILFILGSFVKIGYLYFIGNIANIIFPTNTSIFQSIKIIYTPMILIIIFEYFITSEMPKNYLVSRLLSLFVMIFMFLFANLIAYWLNKNVERLYLFFSYVVAILLGQTVAIIIQRTNKIKIDKIISSLVFIILTTFIIVFSFVEVNSFIFK